MIREEKMVIIKRNIQEFRKRELFWMFIVTAVILTGSLLNNINSIDR